MKLKPYLHGTRKIAMTALVVAASVALVAPQSGAVPATPNPPTNVAPPEELDRVGNAPVPVETPPAMPARPESDGGNEQAAKPQKQTSGDVQARALAGCADYWNPGLNSWFMVCGRILDKYNELGGPGGKLGLPTSNELTNPGNTGKRTSFANNSSIYWSSATDAHQIGGLIGAEWAARGYEGGPLGYPITDELVNPDNIGRRNQFQGGSIYWSQATNARTVWGLIRDRWSSKGWESGPYGYPTSNEYDYNGGKRQNFQFNVIDWNVASVPQEVGSRVVGSSNPQRTYTSLTDADLTAYKTATTPDAASTNLSGGSGTPITAVAARERNLDVTALSSPDASVLAPDELPAEAQRIAEQSAAAPAGCYYANKTANWKSRFGFEAFRQSMTLDWCWNGTGITSYDITDRFAQGLIPGWNFGGATGSGKRLFGTEARAYVQDQLDFGIGSFLSSSSQLCLQLRGSGNLYSVRSTCDMFAA